MSRNMADMTATISAAEDVEEKLEEAVAHLYAAAYACIEARTSPAFIGELLELVRRLESGDIGGDKKSFS